MKILDIPQSGSVAGVTSSRNRFGQYRRSRAIPVNPNTGPQGTVRARLGNNAAGWRTITAAQRAGWIDLANAFTRTNSLGETYSMTGFQCYCLINNNNQAAGNAVVADCPALVTPGTLLTAVVTLTAAAFSVAYTTTPLAAGVRLFSYVSLQRSAGRNFEGDFRLLAVSAAAAASPAVLTTAYTTRFGVPIVGNRIFMAFRLYQTGWLGAPLTMSQVVA